MTQIRAGTVDPDVVIIGSGVGGAAVVLTLAGTCARILILERGPRLPAEPQNSGGGGARSLLPVL